MPYKEARIELSATDLEALSEVVNDLNRVSAEIHGGNLHFGLDNGTVVSFGVRYNEERGEHVISFASLVVADEIE